MGLAELQLALAASLTGRPAAPPPEGCAAGAVARARAALEAKRRRAVRHLLPRTSAALRRGFEECFRQHAGRFTPSAMLYHVDDAWELAARLAAGAAGPARLPGDGDQGGGGPGAWGGWAAAPEVRAAARDDLVELRLRYARRRRPGSGRIGERRGPLLAWISTPRPMLVLRLPGHDGAVWRWPWPR
jgi:hypothetical protein